MPIAFDRTKLTTARAAMEDDYSIELQRSQGCALDMRYRPWHTISYYLGEARVRRSGAAAPTDRLQPPSHLAIYPAGNAEKIRWHGRFEAIHLHIAPHGLTDAAGGIMQPKRADPIDDSHLEGLMGALYEECRGSDDVSRGLIDRLVVKIMRNLARGCSSPKKHLAIGNSSFDAVIASMLTPRSTTLTLGELARYCGVSESYFSRKFSAIFGCSPHDYLLNTRVELAKNRIFQGSNSLADVALETGFCDQAHLARQFRRRAGMTPGQYRSYFER